MSVDVDPTVQSEREPVREWLDLSLAQRGIWFDAHLAASPSAYTLVRRARIAGSIDVRVAQQALTLVIARHDALRLRADDELPRQWLHASSDAPFRALDVSSDAEPERALEAHVDAIVAAPMPFGDRALFSFDLLTARPRDHLILLRCHHLIADDAAIAMILRHWLATYIALTSESAPELAPPSSYLTEIASDAAYLASPRYAADLDYWVARFETLSPPVLVPRGDAAAGQHRGAPHIAAWTLDGDLYARFSVAIGKAGVTPQRALAGLLALVLARRYGHSDITLGLALHRRNAANMHVVGTMAGTIAIRLLVDEFASLLETVRAASARIDEDLRRQRLPVDALTRALGISRGGLAELFQVAVSYVPAGRAPNDLVPDDFTFSLDIVPSTEASPLTLHAKELPGEAGLALDVAALPAYLDADGARRLMSLLREAIERFVSEPTDAVDAFPGTTDDERERVVSEFNATDAAYPVATADELFERRVRADPHALAVTDATESLTYAELDERATALARVLVARGARLQSVVGVLLERSVSTVVALLAILKAGCVYLPVDPAYPEQRRAHMLADSGATLVVTNAELAATLSEGMPFVALDDPEIVTPAATAIVDGAGSAVSRAPLQRAHTPAHTAYIIYTSGSTGAPKGVAVPHAAAVNLAFARLAHDPIGPGDRILAAISVGFDVSIGQLLLPFLAGASIVIASDLRTLSAREFWDALEVQRVTHVNSVPSYFESVLAAAPARSSLVRLMLGGEALSPALVRRLRAALPQTEIFNMYGPTEACIDATAYRATGEESEATLPIGKPLPNYRAYVLDANLAPVGIGIAGDLYLAGAGLAHGYVNAPGLTAERFIANPFGAPGDRLYKTGDRAAWNEAGELAFFGRADSQVKIRGHRIELGEIEAALRAHPALERVAAIVTTDRPGDARLIAYVVPRPGHAEPSDGELRAHLAASLPDYMLPAAFARLGALPLTRNGKLDRRALPRVEIASTTAFVAPRTASEDRIATLFVDLLGIERVGRDDNFFELGGHSLLATRLVSRIRSDLGVRVALRTVFENATPASLAASVDDATNLGEDVAPLAAATRPERLPLSYSQERLWFLSALQADHTYHIPLALRIRGALRERDAVRALERIVARHEALRTCIAMHEGTPFQRIRPPEDACGIVAAVDLRTPDGSEPTAAFERRVRDLVRAPFDLANELPVRIELIRLASADCVLAVAIHHAFFDGWSAAIFFEEFARFYAASSGDEPEAARPEVQYADFALWQRSQDHAADLAYWRARLAGAPARLTLPGERRTSERAGGPAGIVPIALPPSLGESLAAAANASGASTFMVFHAVLAVVLARASGEHDLTIGTVVANRPLAAFEAAIGCFVNTLALRTELDPSATFAQLLASVRESDLAAYERQGVPFEKLVDALAPERSLAQTPLFGVMLVVQEPLPTFAPDGLAVEIVPLEPVPAKFDLTFNLARARDGGFTGSLEFASERFERSAMQRLAAQFERLLALVATDPNLLPFACDLLDPAERERVVSEFNATDAAYPVATADELFERRVRADPHALAVTDATESLTYAELDERATALARVLVARGARLQSVVGVLLERSVSTVVALLAILKAGCVYLPADPAYPEQRRAHMLADSGATLVVTNAELAATLSEGMPFVALDDPEIVTPAATAIVDGAGSAVSRAPLQRAHTPAHTAYIIYTSGSTGAPKGVAVPHAAAVNLAFARLAHDPIGPGDRILAAISVGFDVSIGQLLLPFLAGASIVIASDLRTLSAREFWDALEVQRVTHVNSVPSYFESVLAAAPARSSLVRLMLGGEALSPALVRRLRAALPQTEIFNMYGPTEACIDATAYRATGEESEATLPIGKPLPNYRAYVLDANLAPVGIGIAGDLYLAGAGLAHGYVNAPGLTAERFIANPFGAPGDRLYKTGDRAAWNEAGELAFFGRADSQVKIRGHRIELGEIEAALRTAVPAIREAAVVVREDAPGARLLVAYYTGFAGAQPQTFRRALLGTLPEYMLPSAYVRLDALPLTANGKLDHRALPAPDLGSHATRAWEPPRGETEERIAAAFARALHLDRVGRDENFFELGGHSLLAMTVVERLREAGFGVDVRALFLEPTPAGLATLVHGALRRVAVPPNAIPPGATAIVPEMLPLVRLTQAEIDAIVRRVPGGAANVQDVYPLAPLQEGILFHHVMSEKGDAYLTPFLLGFDRRGRLESFLRALREIVARHDILRTAFVWRGLREPVQVVLRDAALRVEDVAVAPDRDAVAHLLERYDSKHVRLEIGEAPLLRAYLARDDAHDRWLLLLLSHHLILDHASLDVILAEVGALAAGRRDALPPPTAFRTFVAEARLGVSPSEHEAFFREMLGDVTVPTTPYGLERVRGDGDGIREASAVVDASLAERLRVRARALGVGPATLFHMAWALVLAHVSSRDDVVFGTVLFGRMQAEDAQRTLGMFINTLPIRMTIDTVDVETAVLRAHRRLAGLIAHEHASLALAQRCSGVPAPAPLFSALFNFRHSAAADPGARTWPGVELLFVRERTDYPVAVAIDDRGVDFLITAQADAPCEPADLCAYVETAMANLLTALESTPRAPLASVRVLAPATIARVTAEFNATNAAFEIGTLSALFEAQVARTPHALAVTSDGEALSYAELDARAESLADVLASRGIGVGQVVGVALPRSPATVVALLAILKAGAVYLPLDPAYPRERLAFMVADSGANAILVRPETEGVVPGSIARIDVDSGVAAPRSERPAVEPDATAYVIYTSGSTGSPKGVAVPHSAAANLAFARLRHDPIGPDDRILAAISVGFDVSIGQLLLPLVSGASVVIASDLRTLSAREFWEFLETHRVTHVNSVPSFFASVLDAAPPTSSLVRLMLGGEPLSPALVRRLRAALPHTEIFNMYGPTEACIDATAYRATGDETGATLPIGSPLPNYRAYVLDARLAPVGIGVAGDLFLAGAGLADGYVNAPALTAERFIADPFGAPGERLYRTGDRARWNADGRLEFLGRADDQVKIRGHRIELGEIETALRAHAAIDAAAVLATTDGRGEARLIAYVVPLADREIPLDAELRSFLATTLPDYMLPAAFCELPALPLTRNGKLDRRALPVPQIERGAGVEFEAPRTATEIALQRIWRDVLDVDPIGRHDDFFSLGGHSLSAIRLITACNTHFERDLALRVLFERPTLAQLADAIDADQFDANASGARSPVIVTLRAGGDATPLFCVHPAGGAAFAYAPLSRCLAPGRPVYGVQARALEAGEPLAESIEAMAADYVAEMRAMQPAGPYQLLGWSSGGLIAYEIAQQLRRLGERVAFLALVDTAEPLATRVITPTESHLARGLAAEFGVTGAFEAGAFPATIDDVFERARAAGLVPAGFDRAFANRVAAVFRNTVRLYRAYVPAPWSGPFLFVRALRRADAFDVPPDWSAYVSAEAAAFDLPCTHAELMQPEQARALAAHIEPLLDERQRGRND